MPDVARKLVESYVEHGDELPSLIKDLSKIPDKIAAMSIGVPA